jgi:ParB-like chromosome segregation protein Spo0J
VEEKQKSKSMKISKLKNNPNNPRFIKDDKFEKLKKSISEFPEMMEKRPIVCVTDDDGKLYPLGGNMRLKALQELGYKEISDNWILLADEWTEEQRREFVIKDNVGFGEWNWEELANAWDSEKLEEWGLDLPGFESYNDINYSEKNKEIYFDDLKDEIEMKLTFNQDEFNFINSSLSKISSSKENAILKILNYES